jgi:hypothetical protein
MPSFAGTLVTDKFVQQQFIMTFYVMPHGNG